MPLPNTPRDNTREINKQEIINAPSIDDLTLAHLIHGKIDQIHAILGNNYRSHQEIADFIIPDITLADVLDIDDLELPTRVRSLLLTANIRTTADLTQKTEIDILKMPMFGKLALSQIKDAMGEKGYSLKPILPDQDKTLKPTSELLSTSAPHILEDDMAPYDSCMLKLDDDYTKVIHMDTASEIKEYSKEEEMTIRKLLEAFYWTNNRICDAHGNRIDSQDYIDATWSYIKREGQYFWDFNTYWIRDAWVTDLQIIHDTVIQEKQWSTHDY